MTRMLPTGPDEPMIELVTCVTHSGVTAITATTGDPPPPHPLFQIQEFLALHCRERGKRFQISTMATNSCNAAGEATIEIDGSMVSTSYRSGAVDRQVNIAHAASLTADGEDLDPGWVNSMRDKVKKEPRKIKASPSSCFIHRIPPTLRHLDKKAYEPQIISIGPFHYARDGLQDMEEHKWRYLSSLLLRNGKHGQNEKDYLELCLQVVKKLEKRARECYSEEINLNSKSFVEMMVLDACFLIELFVRVSKQHEHDDDPILNVVLRPTITTDLIMLENQIPFFILEHLFHLMHNPGPSLKEMALKFLCWRGSLKNMMTESSINHSNPSCHHLLHLLHLKCCPSLENEDPDPGPNCSGMIPCASELLAAGIKFKKGVADSGFLDIEYCKEQIVMPPIRITRNSETIFLNLVALEQFYPDRKPYVTAYIIFMDRLINTVKDVGILSKEEIIVEKFGSSDDVATLFNKIGRELWVCSKKNYLKNDCRRIHQSTKRVWPRLRATLMRDYFNSPWAFISFSAAVVLLVFTFSQTFFSAFPKFAFEK